MNLKNNLWLIPFFSFLSGYLVFRALNKTEYLEVPPLVGLTLQDAATKATQARLAIRLVAEKEDADLPEGTILSQTPAAPARLKPNQALILVASKKPAKMRTPDLGGLTLENARRELQEAGIRSKIYLMQTPYPKDQCFGQMPAAGTPADETKVLMYISAGTNKQVIMPNCKKRTIHEIMEFLNTYPVTAKITHEIAPPEGHHCTNCFVTDQRPLAGSLITLSQEKPLVIHLQVAAQ